jgi:A/G-specific adenine glycosylase
MRAALRDWYRPRRSRYPWRETTDPYRILVSEIMLQQTQASRVVPAYERFLRAFPSVLALADASRGEVIRAWTGLGYNRRAVALHAAARAVVRDHHGGIPRDREALVRLPGVGPYTASAVAAFGWREPLAPVDTNVGRVVARARMGLGPEEVTAGRLAREAQEWLDRSDPGSWSQALMDLGRDICRPLPKCEQCPLTSGCLFHRAGRDREPPVATPRQGPFEGSFRQLRGRLVQALCESPNPSLVELAAITGQPLVKVHQAVSTLVADGLARAGPAAMAGRPRGRVRLGA